MLYYFIIEKIKHRKGIGNDINNIQIGIEDENGE